MDPTLVNLFNERKQREEEKIRNPKKRITNNLKPVIILHSISSSLQRQFLGDLSNFPLTQPAVINKKGEFIKQPLGKLDVSDEECVGACFFTHNSSEGIAKGTNIYIDESVTILLDGNDEQIYSQYFYEPTAKFAEGRKCKIGLWVTKYNGIGICKEKYNKTISPCVRNHKICTFRKI